MDRRPSRTGEQVMTSSGLKMDGTWARRDPKCCLACKAPAVFYDRDDDRCIFMTCDECAAIEIITKGKTWWYHGARQAHEWPKAFIASLAPTAS